MGVQVMFFYTFFTVSHRAPSRAGGHWKREADGLLGRGRGQLRKGRGQALSLTVTHISTGMEIW